MTREHFVSYASEDEAAVEALLQVKDPAFLDACFFARRTTRPGDHWPQRLAEELAACAAFHLFWSAAAARSEWVEREWRSALGRFAPTAVPHGFCQVYCLDDTPLPEDIRQRIHVIRLEPPSRRDKQVAVARLPRTDGRLFGRAAELAALQHAWDDPGTRVYTLVAWGGVGKTALVSRWVHELSHFQWPGVARAFAWSFYSQGAGAGRQASADLFIATALGWFGDPNPNQGSPWEKGERLAALVRARPTLLVLDGLEAVQFPPGPQGGALKDPALQVLVSELAAQNRGLLVITTRLAVAELEACAGTTAVRHDLETLTPAAGAELLRARGVRGDAAELEAAAREFGGHALALRLLGSYLAEACEGDVRRRDTIPALTAADDGGAHARRVVSRYERWLGEGPELALLRVLGLFDRPAERAAIEVLRKPPAVAGLTDALAGLGEHAWNRTVARLGQLGLVRREEDDALDAHPLVREHFGEQVEAQQPAAWRTAHGRLYEHYKALPEKDLPDTLEELEPLFRAVGHGCAAGRHQEALDEVYYRRIQRGNTFYSTNMLGAFGADLAAVSHFFAEPWRRPIETVTAADQAWLLGGAGFRLRALGRLADAVAPMAAALERYAERASSRNAAAAAGNLSELLLALGGLSDAEARAREAVAHAERSGDTFQRMSKPTTVADALHQGGRLADAAALFEEAERLQAEDDPHHPRLYSIRGYLYCDLLLSRGQAAEARRRAEQTLSTAVRNHWLLDIALDHLTLGRALLALPRDAADLAAAAAELDRAVTGLRAAGTLHHLPRGLLARASLRRDRGDRTGAQRDLDEARTICERCGLRLFLADVHLEQARLHLAFGEREPAHAHYERASALVAEMGYHRRDPEVRELEEQLA